MPKLIENPRERIILEASSLLKSQGYSALTIQAVAKHCGMAVGTVYNYFSSKDEVLAACISQSWAHSFELIQTVSRYADSLEAVVRCIYDQLRAFGQDHALLFSDEVAAASVDGLIFRHVHYLSAQISRALEKFCTSPDRAQIIAEALIIWVRTGKSYEQILACVSAMA